MRMWVCTCRDTTCGGQGIGFESCFFPSHGTLGSDASHQACRQVPVASELPHQPFFGSVVQDSQEVAIG